MRRMSIGIKLLTVYVIIALPLLGLVSYTYYKWYQSRTDLILTDRIQLAQLTANSFSHFIHDLCKSMEYASMDLTSGHETTQTVDAGMRSFLTNYPVSYVCLTDSTGTVVLATDKRLVGSNLGREPAFKSILNSARQKSIQPINQATKPPGFFVVQKLCPTEDTSITTMASFVDIARLKESLPVGVLTHGNINIIDSSGNLVFFSGNSDMISNHPYWGNHDIVKNALTGKSATTFSFALPDTKKEQIEAEVPIKEFGWAAGAGFDRETALAPMASFFSNAVLASIAVLIMAFIVSFVVARRIAVSLTSLSTAARSVGEGHFDIPVDIRTGDEVEDVAKSLNEARIKLKQARDELQQGEAKFRAFFEQAAVGVGQANLEGRWMLANQKLCDILGYTQEELTKMTFHKVSHPDDLAIDLAYVDLALAGDIETYTLEKRNIRKNGNIVWINLSASLVRDVSGKPEYFISIIEDITKRKELELFSQARNEINTIIGSTLSENKLMNDVLRVVAYALDADAGAVYVHEQGFWVERSAFNRSSDIIGTPIPKDKTPIFEYTAQLHYALAIDDVTSDNRLNQEIMNKYGIKSRLMIPLSIRDENIGVMALDFIKRKMHFSREQIDFANKFIVALSLALENAQMFAAQREEATLSNALNRINSIINSTLDFDEILQSVVIEGTRAIGAESCAIFFPEDDDALVARYTYGLPKDIEDERFTPEMLKHTVAKPKDQRTIVIADAKIDSRINPQFISKFNISSILDTSMSMKDKSVGDISFHWHTKHITPTSLQINFAEKLAVSVSLALSNARLYSIEHDISNTLQSALLTIPQHIDKIEIGHIYLSATETAKVGGDFYDLFEIDERRIGILLGDVSGKGIYAAAMTTAVKNTVRAYAIENDSPSVIMKKTNEAIRHISKPSSFITAIFAILEKDTGKLVYCNAGHPPAIIRKANADAELLEATSPLIGVFEDLEYSSDNTTLEYGDVLILYTDGVIEARCAESCDDDLFFGEERLIENIKETAVSAKDMPEMIYAKILECSGRRLLDDIAILAISFTD